MRIVHENPITCFSFSQAKYYQQRTYFLRFLILVSCALVIVAYEHFLPTKSSFIYLSMVDQSSFIHGLATNE